jgi:hypothetical protein
MIAQQTSNGPDNASLAISPALIVGIVIVAAFFSIILVSTLYRFCSRRKGNNGMSSATFNAHDNGDLTGLNLDGDFWNPNRQRSAEQIARMKEVREINNMYAWERANEVRMGAGEIRSNNIIMGRKGENKSWDEYTIGEDSSGQQASHLHLQRTF